MTRLIHHTTSPRPAPRRGGLRAALLLGLLSTMLLAAPARADVRTEARRHFRAGMALVQEGQIDAGVAELPVPDHILPHPTVLYTLRPPVPNPAAGATRTIHPSDNSPGT